MMLGNNIDEEGSLSEYKQNRERNYKIRSHLVTEQFLLTIIKVLSSNVTILRRSLVNIKRFLDAIDRKYYCRDVNTEAMLLTCDMLVATRMANPNTLMDENVLIFKVQTLLTDQYEECRDNLIIPTIKLSRTEMPEDELEFINVSLDFNLKYNKIISEKDLLYEIASEISTCAYTDFKKVFVKFRKIITDFYNFFRSTDSDSNVNQIVHTSESTFIDYLKETMDSIKNPESALITGIKYLNSSLGPRNGFQNKNAYIFYANTNSFKSAFLLHIARMIQKYNADRVIKRYLETGKIPTILFVECENDDDEDNERLFKMVSHKNLGSCSSKEELEQMWNKIYKEDPNNPIDISFLHVDARSMSVQDIDNTIESLNEEGYEVICTIIDYLEMIAPAQEDAGKDIRLQYKNIAESLLNLAKNRSIPVITAHQLNRAGGALLANSKMQGKSNVLADMTNEYIGESYAIEKAMSYSAFIDIEERDGKKYLVYKRNKTRYSRFGKEYFVHEIHDGIILEDDLELDHPLSLDKIPDGETSINMTNSSKEGSRGKYDIRTNVTEPKPVAANKPIEEPLNRRHSPMSLLLNYNDWFNYIDKLGLENICEIQSEITIGNSVLEKVGDSYYYFLDV